MIFLNYKSKKYKTKFSINFWPNKNSKIFLIDYYWHIKIYLDQYIITDIQKVYILVDKFLNK